MDSFSLSTVSAATAATTNRIKTNFQQFETHTKQNHRFKVSCNANPNDNIDKTLETSLHMRKVDRRNMILGLGGVFVACNLTSLPLASADVIFSPSNLSDCTAATLGMHNPGDDVKDAMADSKEGVHTNKSGGIVKKVEDMKFPVKLDETVKVLVKRPAVNRTKEEKEKANEILLVNGVRFDGEKFVKFDVFVNDKDNGTETTPQYSEFAGSFAQMPHGKTDKMMMTSGARFGLTELLEDIKAEDDEYVCVTLVPRTGCDDVTVSEIKIELVPIV